jgi:hypothetical protein
MVRAPTPVEPTSSMVVHAEGASDCTYNDTHKHKMSTFSGQKAMISRKYISSSPIIACECLSQAHSGQHRGHLYHGSSTNCDREQVGGTPHRGLPSFF